MTQPLRGRLLLDALTVHGPAIEVGCSLLRQQPLNPEDFQRYIHPGQPEAELLPFLLESGLAEPGRGGVRLSRAYRLDWSPKLNLLRLLHSKRDLNHTFRFIWETLLERPEWAGQPINRDELWPVLNQLHPEGASLPSLNSNRMASWLRLASWIGLVQPERSNTIILLPSLSFVAELLASTLIAHRETPLANWVADVEAQFCRITTGPDELHIGVGRALLMLEATGKVGLSLCSDAQVIQTGTRRVSQLQWKGGPPYEAHLLGPAAGSATVHYRG